MNRIFISYKRTDKKKVFRLKRRIEYTIKEKCWLDLDGIESDEQFISVIMTAINDAQIVLFMYSSAHKNIKDYECDWTIRELSYATKRGKRIVFINLDGSALTDWFEFNYGLKQQIDARKDEDIKRLLIDLKKWLKTSEITENKLLNKSSNKISGSISNCFKYTISRFDKFLLFLKQKTNMLRLFLLQIPIKIKKLNKKGVYFSKSIEFFIINIIKKRVFLYGSLLFTTSILLAVFFYPQRKTKSIAPPSPIVVDTTLNQELTKLENNLVYIEGGTIMMGDTINIKSFYLCKYEVTQSLWKTIMKNSPSHFKGDDFPVENVSWTDCQTFINQLNNLSKKGFRLPTEAEWEYAARGGNKSNGYIYSGSNDLNEVGWYSLNSNEKNSKLITHPVGKKKPNELGLYDMSGNVSEWCSTNYSEKYGARPEKNKYVFRGGAWLSAHKWCRTRIRNAENSDFKSAGIGLRIATNSK